MYLCWGTLDLVNFAPNIIPEFLTHCCWARSSSNSSRELLQHISNEKELELPKSKSVYILLQSLLPTLIIAKAQNH